AAGPARTISRSLWLETRADRFALGFIEQLQRHQTFNAHELTRYPPERKPLPSDNPEPYAKDPEMLKSYNSFLTLPAVKVLLEQETEANLDSLSAKFLGGDDNRDHVEVPHRTRYPAAGANQTLEGRMYLVRTLAYGTAAEQWQILPPAMRGIEE